MQISRMARAPIALALAVVAGVAMLAGPMLQAANAEAPPGPVDEAPLALDQGIEHELLTLQQALAAAEAEAMKDPALRRDHDALQEAIQEAMREADPTHDERVSRLQAIEQELTTSQASGEPLDMAKLQPLLVEARTLQQGLVQVQQQVVEQEPLKSRIQSLRERMLAEMTKADPTTPQHLERLEALVTQLQASGG